MRFDFNLLQGGQMAVPGFSMSPYMGDTQAQFRSGGPDWSRLSQTATQPAMKPGNKFYGSGITPPGALISQLPQNNGVPPGEVAGTPIRSGPDYGQIAGQPPQGQQIGPRLKPGMTLTQQPTGMLTNGVSGNGAMIQQQQMLGDPSRPYGTAGPMGMLTPQAVTLKQLMANPAEIQRRNQYYSGL